jgi:GT2 family glycosyltransferase
MDVECTAVVVTYNCHAVVRDCLRSLHDDQRVDSLQVVVVDNASGDGTADLVRHEFPSVVLIESDQNRGFAWATNRGIERAEGAFVLLLNPDTVVPPGGLRLAIDELRRRPNVGVLGCRLVRRDGTLDHACKRGCPTPLAALYYLLRLHRRFPGDARFDHYVAGQLDDDQEGFVDAVNGAFMLVRREALDDVGLLDERFWMYGEDLDWCRRSWHAGWPILYWPGITVTHLKGGTDGGRRSPQATRAFYESMWLYYDKHERKRRMPVTTGAVRLGVVTAEHLAVRSAQRSTRGDR